MGQIEANLAVVRRLCEQWPWMNEAEYAELLAPDCLYVNIPRPEERMIGPAAAHGLLGRFAARLNIGLEVLNIVAQGDVVLTERLERFERISDGAKVDLYVMGAFELKAGRITAWRDYFESSFTRPLHE